MDINLIFCIIYGLIIGGFVAVMNYGAGKLGQTGDTIFNYVKGGLCMVVGAVFGAWLAYSGGSINPDFIMQLFSTVTIGGFGIVWMIDTATQMIVAYLQPKASLGKSMALPKPGLIQ